MNIIIGTYKDKVWGRNVLKKSEMIAFIKESLQAVGIQPKQVALNVSFIGAEKMIEYNSKYRGKNAVTNVLSFANKNYMEDKNKNNKNNVYKVGLIQLGDMLLCYEQIEAEAKQFGKTFYNRLAHLFVHSVLHLIGYDHIQPDERKVMEDLEERILAKFGVRGIYNL